MNLKTTLILSFIYLIHGAKLPSYIRKCKYDEIPQCAVEAANEALPTFIHGDATFGTPSFLPFKINEVNFDDDRFKMKFHNVEVHGFDNMKVSHIHLGNPYLKFNFGFHFEKLTMIGEYEPNGTIYDITLPDKGYASFILEDVSYSMGVTIGLRETRQYHITDLTGNLRTAQLLINFYELGTNKLLYTVKDSKVLSKPVLKEIESQLYEVFRNVGINASRKYKFEDYFEGLEGAKISFH